MQGTEKFIGRPIFFTLCYLVLFCVVIVSFPLIGGAKAGPYGLRDDNAVCLRSKKTWQKRKGWKAFAITRTVGIAQGCGFSWSAKSAEDAKKIALKSCNQNISYKIFQGKTSCRIVALKN